MTTTQLHLAPLQGYTDAEYRNAHRAIYGGDYIAYTPFLRIEKSEIAPRTLRDALSPLNAPLGVIPQIIFGSIEEFDLLTSTLRRQGFTRIDLNLGCPFPPQVKRGRGAGTLTQLPLLTQIAQRIASDPVCAYSVKMRTGITDHHQWRPVLDILNTIPLTHITVHPRRAIDQYRGTADRDTFAQILHLSGHPLVYNGDIATPRDIHDILADHPTVSGIMVGRGLLARPSLFAEYTQGSEWTHPQRIQAILRLHDTIRAHYQTRLCGDHQLLSKLLPFWEYLEPEIGHRPWKAIRKTRTLAAYTAALSTIL